MSGGNIKKQFADEGFLGFFDAAFARPNQSLRAHAENVSAFAAALGNKLGVAEFTRVAGFLHDVGKITPEFQTYLTEGGKRGSVRHSAAGGKTAYDAAAAYDNSSLPSAGLIAEILGNIIAAHHGKLYDSLSPNGDTDLNDKLSACEGYDLPAGFCDIDINRLDAELASVFNAMPLKEKAFGLSMLVKFGLSCLVDADRFDAFLHGKEAVCAQTFPNWSELLSNMEEHLKKSKTKA